MNGDEALMEDTEIAERSLRRLAARKGVQARKVNGSWMYNGVALNDDDFWAVCSSL